MDLTAEELRVLCVLVEKSFTTPDQYPLTTNALMAGCNQRTSRDPIVDYSTSDVDSAMQSLRTSGWARTVRVTGSRTSRHKHVVAEQLPINDSQLALLAVLGLRGAQSPGELKTRTERYVAFESFDDVVNELESMATLETPLVRNIGTRSGQSQPRWVHLLGSGSTQSEATTEARSVDDSVRMESAPNQAPIAPTLGSLVDKITGLEKRVAELEWIVQSNPRPTSDME